MFLKITKKLLLLLLLIILISCTKMNYSSIMVTKVIDGDTIEIATGERVRLIGIDTPELHISEKLYKDAKRTNKDIQTIQKLGEKAYYFAKKLMEGKKVKLEYDIEKKDRYGRLLAYVFLEDGTFINAKLVEEGYAKLYTFPPNVKYVYLLTRLQKEARENTRGLWGN